jgi:23S rRNA (uracil1939-C5)-methyltransferase
MNIRIEKIVYPGRSLAREGGKVIFTDEGLPGELVEAELIREKPRYAEATTLRVLEPSPSRVPPRCSHYRACSPYQCIDYPVQVQIKTAQIREMLSHHLKYPADDLIVIPSPKVWSYRNKARLHLLRKAGEFSWAYHAPGEGDAYVPVDSCHLLSDMMNAIFSALLAVIREQKIGWIAEATVRESLSSGRLLLLLAGSPPHDASLLRAALEGKAEALNLAGVALDGNGRRIQLFGSDSLVEKVENVEYSYGPSSFFQVNVDMLALTLRDIKESLRLNGEETVADLYCGVGTFGLALASSVQEVIGVESSRDSIPFLERNIERNRSGNFAAIEGESEREAVRVLGRGIGVLVVDPPRRGLDDRLRRAILSRPPPRIAYLSCDLATLIRDLKDLARSYRLARVFAYDYFPHTPHIETLAVLERSES